MADQAYGAAQVPRRCAQRSALVDGAEIGHEHSPHWLAMAARIVTPVDCWASHGTPHLTLSEFFQETFAISKRISTEIKNSRRRSNERSEENACGQTKQRRNASYLPEIESGRG